MPHPGNSPETYHHFLAEEQDREKKNQAPEQLHAIVLTQLQVHLHAAGVIPPAHDDEAWAEDDKQHPQFPAPGIRRSRLAPLKGAKSAHNVARFRKSRCEIGRRNILVFDSQCHAFQAVDMPSRIDSPMVNINELTLAVNGFRRGVSDREVRFAVVLQGETNDNASLIGR